MKLFHHRPQEHLTDTRLAPLESRRAALPRYYESEASQNLLNLLCTSKQSKEVWRLKFGHTGMWLAGTSCTCNEWAVLDG